ncbi:MAG: hypothetical protein QOK03_2193 [Candidatus Binataceae bacterium]|nr:hypothetical protein [Candidatus Binataceae bacterium]
MPGLEVIQPATFSRASQRRCVKDFTRGSSFQPIDALFVCVCNFEQRGLVEMSPD